MRTRNALTLTLAGILGIAGCVSLATTEIERMKEAKSRIPERYLEIERELDNAGTKLNEARDSIYELARNTEVSKMAEKYIPLIKELDSYSNDPNLQQVMRDYHYLDLTHVFLGIPSLFSTFVGVSGAITSIRKKKLIN